MAEKKATKKATVKKASAKTAAAPKKAAVKKVAEKKAVKTVINSENVGFKAGDVYQALATAKKALTVSEIAKAANITKEEVLLGTGWLLKEGKVKDEAGKITLA